MVDELESSTPDQKQPGLPGELVCAEYPRGSGTQLMIRRERDETSRVGAKVWKVYINGTFAYGPYWRPEEAYARLHSLGGERGSSEERDNRG